MTGRKPRITEEQRRRFFYLTMEPNGPMVSKERAAREVGISKASAYRIKVGVKYSPAVDARMRQADLPDPRQLHQLSTDAVAALEDPNLFGEMFFALRPSIWRYDAIMRFADAILDHSRRTFIDLNVFPGAGKTTMVKVLCCWLIAGGGAMDPAAGRAIRLMLGSETQKVARHMLRNVRLPLELRRPFAIYEKRNRLWHRATHTLGVEYGRFKPDTSMGDESKWSQDECLVAQLEEVDLTLKEPTLQVASRESGFLGERVDGAIWDDLGNRRQAFNPESAETNNAWVEDEAETRVDDGGVFMLVGQRLGPADIHRKRLDARVEDSTTGELVPLYEHVIYPAHWDELCDGVHRQWNGTQNPGAGCMTDENALPVKDWTAVKSKGSYETVYQQADMDPELALVQDSWLEGGIDPRTGEMFPGCYDRDRGFWEWPQGVGQTIDYVAVDPSAGNWWVAEWWALQPESRHNYMIEGRRMKIQAGAFLDWDNTKQEFTGWMHEMQVSSIVANHPIRVWIIEAVAAHKYLFQFEHYRRWKEMFPFVSVIPHQTQLNKNDAELGVEGLMPGRYRTGMKHLPRKSGDVAALNYIRTKQKELTTYPAAETNDTVMADWCGEWNLDKIIVIGCRQLAEHREVDPDLKLPPYLRRQQREYELQP